MPKIQVTPSLNNSANGKQELDLHPYYKILGKRHNNDYCHACGEYGKILCCDMCTASFHLLCHDPPLNESDIPAGQWFCHSCKYLKVSNNHVNNKLNDIEDESVDLPEINNEIKISSKSHSTMIVKKKRKLDYNESLDNIYCTDDSKVNYDPVEKKKFKASIDEDFEVDSETHLCVMNGNLSDSYSESADNNFCNDSTQAGIISDAFRIIIKEAVRSNPKQFELPEEYENKYSLLPSKEEKEIDYNDLDGCNLIKQPIRICFYCKRCCLYGHMVSCSYCSAHFHLNCLNPPLCYVSGQKWMCPLHPHSVIDDIMDNPDSFTERSYWWKEFNKPIEIDVVKEKMIEIQNLPKTKKTIFNTSLNVCSASPKIPDIVKFHYKYPAEYIPLIDYDSLEADDECSIDTVKDNDDKSDSDLSTSSIGKENDDSIKECSEPDTNDVFKNDNEVTEMVSLDAERYTAKDSGKRSNLEEMIVNFLSEKAEERRRGNVNFSSFEIISKNQSTSNDISKKNHRSISTVDSETTIKTEKEQTEEQHLQEQNRRSIDNGADGETGDELLKNDRMSLSDGVERPSVINVSEEGVTVSKEEYDSCCSEKKEPEMLNDCSTSELIGEGGDNSGTFFNSETVLAEGEEEELPLECVVSNDNKNTGLLLKKPGITDEKQCDDKDGLKMVENVDIIELTNDDSSENSSNCASKSVEDVIDGNGPDENLPLSGNNIVNDDAGDVAETFIEQIVDLQNDETISEQGENRLNGSSQRSDDERKIAATAIDDVFRYCDGQEKHEISPGEDERLIIPVVIKDEVSAEEAVGDREVSEMLGNCEFSKCKLSREEVDDNVRFIQPATTHCTISNDGVAESASCSIRHADDRNNGKIKTESNLSTSSSVRLSLSSSAEQNLSDKNFSQDDENDAAVLTNAPIKIEQDENGTALGQLVCSLRPRTDIKSENPDSAECCYDGSSFVAHDGKVKTRIKPEEEGDYVQSDVSIERSDNHRGNNIDLGLYSIAEVTLGDVESEVNENFYLEGKKLPGELAVNNKCYRSNDGHSKSSNQYSLENFTRRRYSSTIDEEQFSRDFSASSDSDSWNNESETVIGDENSVLVASKNTVHLSGNCWADDFFLRDRFSIEKDRFALNENDAECRSIGKTFGNGKSQEDFLNSELGKNSGNYGCCIGYRARNNCAVDDNSGTATNFPLYAAEQRLQDNHLPNREFPAAPTQSYLVETPAVHFFDRDVKIARNNNLESVSMEKVKCSEISNSSTDDMVEDKSSEINRHNAVKIDSEKELEIGDGINSPSYTSDRIETMKNTSGKNENLSFETLPTTVAKENDRIVVVVKNDNDCRNVACKEQPGFKVKEKFDNFNVFEAPEIIINPIEEYDENNTIIQLDRNTEYSVSKRTTVSNYAFRTDEESLGENVNADDDDCIGGINMKNAVKDSYENRNNNDNCWNAEKNINRDNINGRCFFGDNEFSGSSVVVQDVNGIETNSSARVENDNSSSNVHRPESRLNAPLLINCTPDEKSISVHSAFNEAVDTNSSSGSGVGSKVGTSDSSSTSVSCGKFILFDHRGNATMTDERKLENEIKSTDNSSIDCNENVLVVDGSCDVNGSENENIGIESPKEIIVRNEVSSLKYTDVVSNRDSEPTVLTKTDDSLSDNNGDTGSEAGVIEVVYADSDSTLDDDNLSCTTVKEVGSDDNVTEFHRDPENRKLNSVADNNEIAPVTELAADCRYSSSNIVSSGNDTNSDDCGPNRRSDYDIDEDDNVLYETVMLDDDVDSVGSDFISRNNDYNDEQNQSIISSGAGDDKTSCSDSVENNMVVELNSSSDRSLAEKTSSDRENDNNADVVDLVNEQPSTVVEKRITTEEKISADRANDNNSVPLADKALLSSATNCQNGVLRKLSNNVIYVRNDITASRECNGRKNDYYYHHYSKEYEKTGGDNVASGEVSNDSRNNREKRSVSSALSYDETDKTDPNNDENSMPTDGRVEIYSSSTVTESGGNLVCLKEGEPVIESKRITVPVAEIDNKVQMSCCCSTDVVAVEQNLETENRENDFSVPEGKADSNYNSTSTTVENNSSNDLSATLEITGESERNCSCVDMSTAKSCPEEGEADITSCSRELVVEAMDTSIEKNATSEDLEKRNKSDEVVPTTSDGGLSWEMTDIDADEKSEESISDRSGKGTTCISEKLGRSSKLFTATRADENEFDEKRNKWKDLMLEINSEENSGKNEQITSFNDLHLPKTELRNLSTEEDDGALRNSEENCTNKSASDDGTNEGADGGNPLDKWKEYEFPAVILQFETGCFNAPIAKVKAALNVVSYQAPIIYMYYDTLSFGYGDDSNVCLLDYGHCNFISKNHACIIYDKLTKSYELINYSPYVTTVDNVIYTVSERGSDLRSCNLRLMQKEKNTVPTAKGNEAKSNVASECRSQRRYSSKQKRKRINEINRKIQRLMVKNFPSKVQRRTSNKAEVGGNNSLPHGRIHYNQINNSSTVDIDKVITLSSAEMSRNAEDDLKAIAEAKQKMRTVTSNYSCLCTSSVAGSSSTSCTSFHLSSNNQQDNKRKKSYSPTVRSKRKQCSNKSATPILDRNNDHCPNEDLSESLNYYNCEPETDNDADDKGCKCKSYGFEDGAPSPHFEAFKSDFDSKVFTVDYTNNSKPTSDTDCDDDSDLDNSISLYGNVGNYLNVDDVIAVLNKNKDIAPCNCQLKKKVIPLPRDSSWNMSAPLYHGSYIQFGCIGFVFNIVGNESNK